MKFCQQTGLGKIFSFKEKNGTPSIYDAVYTILTIFRLFNVLTDSDISQVVLCIKSCKSNYILGVDLLRVPISGMLWFLISFCLKTISVKHLTSFSYLDFEKLTHQDLLSIMSIVFLFAFLENWAKKT